VFVLLATSWYCSAASAEDAWTWRTEFGPAFNHFDYREYDASGTRLDSEKGTLPGAVAAISHSWGDWEARIAADYYGQSVTYQGFAFNPATQATRPLETTTRESIGSVEATVTWWLDTRLTRLGVYAGAGMRWWGRDIHANAAAGSSGAYERYRFGYSMLGARARLWTYGALDVGVDGRITRTIDPALDIDYQGAFDSTHLSPTAKTAWRLAIPLDVKLDPHNSLRVEPYYLTWSMGKSSIEPLSRNGTSIGLGIYEPRSETASAGLSVSWMHTF